MIGIRGTHAHHRMTAMTQHRVEADRVAVPGRPLGALAQDQEPDGASGESRNRGGVAVSATAEQKVSNSRDERDAETILLTIESDFRRALDAEQTYVAWRHDNPNAPFANQLQMYAGWIEASEPYAAGYRRISTAFPGYMDRLHELLLPVQHEIMGVS
jgi:hypothetical protein